MKRPPQALVSYASSDDDSEHDEPEIIPEPPLKKRKLPALADSLRPSAPINNPALHQGRVRSSPHVEGQWAAHIYVPVFVDAGSALGRLLDDVQLDAREMVPSLIEIGVLEGKDEVANDAGDAGKGRKKRRGERELHVSLSRPTYLRAHQREDLKRAIKTVAKAHAPFKASFATFSALTNDEKTRTFLTLEVGAGHNELRALTEALTPALRAIRQKEFYSDPRFHASIAWALLDARPALPPQPPSHASPVPFAAPTSQVFPTIPHFPPTFIASLIAKHSAQLARPVVGAFEVGEVKVKIGREEHGWKMGGTAVELNW
ncbi:hypothetical protein FIBSPDRAFT_876858 [Athelia psychrophila]|uniref:U6 snRNA phosphodiesterase 1 n=1 Tax=Athelia psychrophila TaxID=1759441 RepID=A0A167WHF5_9AGAM|nr:hypothetical protein FIBSPDRAFT_876858 [Fibularhizoctonia sp. CBS 109695]